MKKLLIFLFSLLISFNSYGDIRESLGCSKDISMYQCINKEKIEAEEKKKAEEKRESDAKKAGYKSYDVMLIELKKKRVAKTKELQAKAAELEKNRDAKTKESQAKAADKKNIKLEILRKNAKNNPGFRDLRPGMPLEDYKRICPRVRCYGIKDIIFSVETFKANAFLTTNNEPDIEVVSKLVLDMGPIASDGLFLDIVNDLIESDSNIYRKMKRTMDTKYALDFEFSERDRQLFNENEKKELLVAYSNGQVVLKINRRKKENSYSEDLWLYIEYRNIDSGKLFLNRNRPVEANLNDF